MSKSERIPQQRIYHIIDTTLGKDFLVKARSREHAIRILTEPRYFTQVAQPLLIADLMGKGYPVITDEEVSLQTNFDFDYPGPGSAYDPETNTDKTEEPIAALNGSAQQ